MKQKLELYIHIPFCIKKCAYCDFLSETSVPEERAQYVHRLVREIESYRELAAQYEISTIFIGGGTPSVLTAAQTEDIFNALSDVFIIGNDAEITTEVNPGTLTAEKLECYRRVGINRLSIGLQSVNDEELINLGRIHTYNTFLQTYRAARVAGFQNINIDLISAIPGQTLASWKKTLETIIQLNPQPEHISAYSLIIEEGTPFYQLYQQPSAENPLQLPDEDEERLIYGVTKSLLNAAGYERYEISNYASPGYECRHNLGYWERKEYLGLGLGASSLMNNQRFSNPADMTEYLTDAELTRNRQELSRQECVEEFMFLGLRKMKGISKDDFCRQFDCAIEAVYGDVINELKQEQLITGQGEYLKLTERGIDVSNYVFTKLLL
ncbi:MAG: radical SAM family heme chaperone HemW [Lachnospiraceae bacterium]